MAKVSGKAYLGLNPIVCLILAIIPITNIIFGVIERAKKGNILGIILNIILCFIFYFIDLITVIIKGKVTVLC